jgi:uncharacterized protein (TIGR03437 family)
LNRREAEVLAPWFFEDMSNQDIARLLGISQIHVAVLHRSPARLQKELSFFYCRRAVTEKHGWQARKTLPINPRNGKILAEMSGRVCWASVCPFAIGLAIATSARAQHTELATNGDGSVLYVVSYSALRDATTPTQAETRLYRIDSDGARLWAQRDRKATSTGTSIYSIINGAPVPPLVGIGVPQVTDDGHTVAYTMRGVCVTTDPCVTRSLSELNAASTVELGPGTVQISRNGRWAVLSYDRAFHLQDRRAELIHLDTGQRTPVPEPLVTPFGVASDGSVLTSQGGYGLWRDGQFSSLSFEAGDEIHPWALSDNARVFVYSELTIMPPAFAEIQLKARDIASGHDTVLTKPNAVAEPAFLSMSNDGRLVLFQIPGPQLAGPVFLADTNTGQSAGLALPDGELAVTGTISGDGSVVIVATTSGRIVKFHVAGLTGTPEILIPSTPDVGHGRPVAVGSLMRLSGYIPGSADELRGRILLDGQPVPVLFIDSNGVAIQVPWELHIGEIPFRLDIPSDSPFIDYELVTAVRFNPAFEPLSPGETAIAPVKLIKGDFSGLVTTQPQPGDIVITYMTGLGPVRGQPQTAVPAPLDRLMPLDGQITCTFLAQQTSTSGRVSQQSTAETLFAGLAPGLIGTYQVSFRMPPDAGQGQINGARCQLTTPLGGGTLVVFFGGPLATFSLQ